MFLQGLAGGALNGTTGDSGASWLGRLLRDFFRALAVVVMLSVVWLFGAVFCRRYYSNVTGAAAGGGADLQSSAAKDPHKKSTENRLGGIRV